MDIIIILFFASLPTMTFSLIGFGCFRVQHYRATGIVSLICAVLSGIWMHSSILDKNAFTVVFVMGTFVLSFIYGISIIGVSALINLLMIRRNPNQDNNNLSVNPLGGRVVERIMLLVSAILVIASIVCLDRINTVQDELLSVFCSGTIFICLLPWLVQIRRRLFRRAPPRIQNGTKVSTVLLLIALLVGPITTAPIYHLLKCGTSNDGLFHFLLWHGVSISGHQVGMGLWVVAFLIQLYHDTWNKVLNCLVILYHFVALLVFVKAG